MALRKPLTLHVFFGMYVVACLEFLHYYASIVTPYLHLPQYLSGTERLPYQARLLPLLLLWPFLHARILLGWATGHGWHALGPITEGPAAEALLLWATVSYAAAAYYTVQLYRAVSPGGRLAPLVLLALLYSCIWSYTLHIYRSLAFPYDLSAMAALTAGILFIYQRRFLPLAAVMVIGTINRETTLFLVPIFLLDALADPSPADPHPNRAPLLPTPDAPGLAFETSVPPHHAPTSPPTGISAQLSSQHEQISGAPGLASETWVPPHHAQQTPPPGAPGLAFETSVPPHHAQQISGAPGLAFETSVPPHHAQQISGAPGLALETWVPPNHAQQTPPPALLRTRLRHAPWLRAAVLLLLWAGVYLLLQRLFAHNDHAETMSRWRLNLADLSLRHLPGMLNACGFLLPLLWLLRKRIEPARFGLYTAVLPLWLAVMAWKAMLLESRVHGEFGGYAAVASVLLVESYLRQTTAAAPLSAPAPARGPVTEEVQVLAHTNAEAPSLSSAN